MKSAERKIIFECRIGSHLYGTNRPESDDDFLGIFLPSQNDMLGLQNSPSEWSMDKKISTGDRNTAGDVDRKYFSIQKFLNLAGQGQSGPIELLFSPESMWTFTSPEWYGLLNHRNMFLSQSTVLPFVGFATAQSWRAVIKGENLNYIRAMIAHLKAEHPHATLGSVFHDSRGNKITAIVDQTEVYNPKYVITEGNEEAIEVAGRQYELTQQVRYVLQKLKRVEEKYGTRSEAAAQVGHDYKSLVHAYRLLFEAKELLSTGKISLPRPPDEIDLLRRIRAGTYEADYFQEIQDQMTQIKKIESPLPKSVDWSRIEKLCQTMLYKHLFEETV